MRIAIITGASSGLGAEAARRIEKKWTYDEFWLIARRTERLEELASSLSTRCRCIALDLSRTEAFDQLGTILEESRPEVGLLYNAAGVCRIGDFSEISLSDEAGMIDLNCRALVLMTQLVIPYMKRGSRIVEIGSTAGFQAFPYLNVYAASKAFVYRYSRALNYELRRTGIRVTVVCPYWIKDTELISNARKGNGSSEIKGFPLASSQSIVVRLSLWAAGLGLPVCTPGIICTLHRIAGQILPSTIMMRVWNLLRKI